MAAEAGSREPTTPVTAPADVPRALRPGRNPALDGLRGLAILLVLVSHSSFPLLKFGGMVGVTLFFVLSGYLITSLLLDEDRQNGTVAFGAFYARRALRLLPALVVVLIVGGIIWVLIGHGHTAADTSQGGLVVLFYLGNFSILMRHVSVAPWDTSWSLAMEEQYYLIWPLLLIVGLRFRVRWLVAATIALAIVSLVLRFTGDIGTRAGYRDAYYLPQSNAWALLFGSALALVLHRIRPITVPRWLTRSAYVGLLALASVVALRTGLHEQASSTEYVIRLIVSPLAGILAVIVLIDAVQIRSDRRWLTHRWLLFFGAISYGLYLWHAVVDSVISTELGSTGVRGFLYGVMGAVIAIGLATLSLYLVEKPFLRRKQRFERRNSDDDRAVTVTGDTSAIPRTG